MAEILLTGIEMPKNKGELVWLTLSSDGRVIVQCQTKDTFKKGKIIEAIEVPSHGDLVDIKDVLDAMNEEIVPKGVFLSDIFKALEGVPIIIEASTDSEASKEKENDMDLESRSVLTGKPILD